MSLSVIIVTYNIRELARQCVRSVLQAHYSGDLEVIVVDNASYDGTARALEEEFPGVTVIRNDHNLGFAAAVNQGVRASSGAQILSLNPDTIIEEETLEVLSGYLGAHPQVGCVGPKILNSDGSFQRASKRGFPRPWAALTRLLGLGRLFPRSPLFARYHLTYLDPDQTHTVDAVSGSCMLMPRAVMEQIGPLDEDFFLGGDDLDYCYRMHKAGFTVVYHPETQIIHYKGESRRAAPYYSTRLHFEAMQTFARKHRELSGGPLSRIIIRAGIVLLWAISSTRTYLATLSSLIIDALVIGAAFVAMIGVRFIPDPRFDALGMLVLYIPVVVVYSMLWLAIGGLLQIYGRYVLSYSRALIASLVGFFIIATLTMLYSQIAYSRIVLVGASALVALALPGWRLLVHLRQATHRVGDSYRTRRPSLFSRRAVILGAGAEGSRIAGLLLLRPDIGMDLLGFVDQTPPADPAALPLPFLGTIAELRQLHRAHRFQEIVVAQGSFSSRQIMQILEATCDLGLLFRMVPDDDEVMLGKANIEHIGNLPFVSVEATLYHRFHLLSKRSFDALAASMALLVLLPAWPILIALYGVQRRTIWNVGGKTSTARLLRRGPAALRRLPLLWSILKGDMSFVGAEVVGSDETDPQLLFKPGITGLAQLRRFSGDPAATRSYQHYYLQHQSLTFDLEVIMKSLLRG